MIYCVRPSKTFLFNVLERKLSKIKGGIGLDAASAGFKNRKMFKTDFYYGLDIDLDCLKSSVKKDKSQNTYAIYADMTKLDKLPSDSVDVIISTNSLFRLAFDGRIKAIKHLCRLLAPKGLMLIDLSLDADFKSSLEIFKNNFKKAKVVYYKNIFSRVYEGFFEKDGFLGSHPLVGTKPFLALAWLISQLEYLTCKLPFLNKHVFIVCTNKKNCFQKNKFDLSSLLIIEKRIYNLMD